MNIIDIANETHETVTIQYWKFTQIYILLTILYVLVRLLKHA